MKLLALFATLLLFPQEKNEAEELFKKLEEKLSRAKSIQMKSSGSTTEARHVGTMTIDITLFASGENRIRMDTEIKVSAGTMKMHALSDGSRLNTKSEFGDHSIETPKTLATDFARAVSRGGTLFATGWLQATAANDAKHPDRRRIPEIAGFRLGKKEKVDGREAQAIEYTLKGLEGGSMQTTLWIDGETGLPVKRETRREEGREETVLVETYPDLKLDEKIDPAKFELPK